MNTKFALAWMAVIAIAPALRADLFVSSNASDSVVDYNANGSLRRVISASQLKSPTGLTIGPDGKLYVADQNQILRFDANTGAFLDVFVMGGLPNAEGLTFGPDGNLYVAAQNGVREFNGRTGADMGTFASGNGLSGATGAVFGADHNLYVSNPKDNNVLEFNGTTGTFIKVFASGAGLSAPADLTFGSDHNLYVVSQGSNQVLTYSGVTGAYVRVAAANNGLNQPVGVAFGPDGNLYVASSSNNEVLRFSPAGVFAGIFASGSPLNTPEYLAFTPATVPEPATLALIGFGLAVMGLLRARTKQRLPVTAGARPALDGRTNIGYNGSVLCQDSTCPNAADSHCTLATTHPRTACHSSKML